MRSWNVSWFIYTCIFLPTIVQALARSRVTLCVNQTPFVTRWTGCQPWREQKDREAHAIFSNRVLYTASNYWHTYCSISLWWNHWLCYIWPIDLPSRSTRNGCSLLANTTGAFQLYDIDGDGFITYDEMLAVSALDTQLKRTLNELKRRGKGVLNTFMISTCS